MKWFVAYKSPKYQGYLGPSALPTNYHKEEELLHPQLLVRPKTKAGSSTACSRSSNTIAQNWVGMSHSSSSFPSRANLEQREVWFTVSRQQWFVQLPLCMVQSHWGLVTYPLPGSPGISGRLLITEHVSFASSTLCPPACTLALAENFYSHLRQKQAERLSVFYCPANATAGQGRRCC